MAILCGMRTSKLTQKARDEVAHCERAIQDIVKEAVADGEYETVMLLTALAKTLGELAAKPSGAAMLAPRQAPARQAKRRGGAAKRDKPTKNGAAKDYPRFLRRGNDLVERNRAARGSFRTGLPGANRIRRFQDSGLK